MKLKGAGERGTRNRGLRNIAYRTAYPVQTNLVAKITENIQCEGADEYSLQYLLLHLAPFSMTPDQGVGYVMFRSETKWKAYVICHSETKW